jgi:L-amino acid N-acyltransferase YncA
VVGGASVAEQSGQVVGWASLSRWSDKAAYDGTAEISVYVSESQQGRGIGKRLLTDIVAAGQSAGLHTLIARITAGNAVSLHLHKQIGFTEVGTLREVGHKFGRYLDVHILQKIYE